MSNCFKWIEFVSTLCTTATAGIESMVENKDLGSALDSYYHEIGNTNQNSKGADSYEARTKLREVFKIVAGEDRLISWAELKEIMDKALQKDMELDGLSASTCRSLLALADRSRLGKLGVREFINIWDIVHLWKMLFLKNDVNNKGYLDEAEVKAALSQARFNISDKTMNTLTIRYGDTERRFFFEDFLICAIKMKYMTDVFKSKQQDNTCTISIAEFVDKTLYC